MCSLGHFRDHFYSSLNSCVKILMMPTVRIIIRRINELIWKNKYKLSFNYWELSFFFKNIFFLLLILEKGKKRERNVHVREKHQSVASCTRPDWGLNPHPRHVPWLGIKPTTFWFVGRHPTNWATLARARAELLNSLGFRISLLGNSLFLSQ